MIVSAEINKDRVMKLRKKKKKNPTYIFDVHFPPPSNLQIYTLPPVFMLTISFMIEWVVRWQGNREMLAEVLIGSLAVGILPYELFPQKWSRAFHVLLSKEGKFKFVTATRMT